MAWLGLAWARQRKGAREGKRVVDLCLLLLCCPINERLEKRREEERRGGDRRRAASTRNWLATANKMDNWGSSAQTPDHIPYIPSARLFTVPPLVFAHMRSLPLPFRFRFPFPFPSPLSYSIVDFGVAWLALLLLLALLLWSLLGLAWLGLAWLGLAWPAWPGLVWNLGLGPDCHVCRFARRSVAQKSESESTTRRALPLPAPAPPTRPFFLGGR